MNVIDKWIRRTDEEKRAHIVAWKESGLTQKAYCENNDLSYKSFEKWLRAERMQQTKLEPLEINLPILHQRTLTAVVIFPSGVQCKLEQISKLEDICLLVRSYERCK